LARFRSAACCSALRCIGKTIEYFNSRILVCFCKYICIWLELQAAREIYLFPHHHRHHQPFQLATITDQRSFVRSAEIKSDGVAVKIRYDAG